MYHNDGGIVFSAFHNVKLKDAFKKAKFYHPSTDPCVDLKSGEGVVQTFQITEGNRDLFFKNKKNMLKGNIKWLQTSPV